MGGLQIHHHQQILMTPISCTRFCLRSIVTQCISTPKLKLCTKSKTITKVSADELKEKWLSSLTCPATTTLLKETENPILQNHENCGNQEDEADVVSQWVLGVDPDVSGALAVLKTDDSGSYSGQVYDSPNVKVLVGNRIRRRMDTNAMVQLLRSLNIPVGTIAYIEQSLPYPGDGKQRVRLNPLATTWLCPRTRHYCDTYGHGWWSGGFNYGLWIGALVASEVSVVPVPSMRWKHEFKLSGNGKTKDDSRALASTLFPALSSSLRRKKDHGRAEALLIAAYGKGIKLNPDSESISNSLIPIETNDP